MKKLKYIIPLLAALATVSAGAQQLALTRDECRSMALAHSEDLKKADNSLRQADLDRKISLTAYLPKIDGSATAMMLAPDIDMMGMKLQNRGTYLAGLQLIQPVYAGGKITAGRHLSAIGRKVAAKQKEMIRMDVIADTDNAYWTLVAVRDKVRLMQAYMAMMDTLYAQVSTAVDAGMAIENDLLRIEAKRSEIAYQLQKAFNGADLCRMSLCNLIGQDYSAQILPTDSVPSCPDPGKLQADITDRPEYHLLQYGIDAAREQVRMTRGDFLPVIGLSLGYNYYGNIKVKGMADLGGGNYAPFTQTYSNGMFMGAVSLSIPIFHWGEGVKKIRRAKLDVENAALDLQKTSSLLDLQTRQAAINLTDGYAMVQTARTALQQAEENLRVTTDRYRNAMASLTDLLDAQTQWQQSRSDLIEARTQYQIYQTAWLRATARL